MRKRVQMFVHRYYNAIKLVLQFAIIGLVLLGLLYQMNANAAITRSIRDETEKQTRIINRQFKALCFLVIETSGEEALRELDPPLERQCLNLAEELREKERQKQVHEDAPVSIGQPQSVATVNPQRTSNPQPAKPREAASKANSPTPTDPVTPQPIRPGVVRGLVDGVSNGLVAPTLRVLDEVLGEVL